MTSFVQIEIEIKTDKDVLKARREAKLMAETVAFGDLDTVRLTTVVSELARNIVKYADSGVCSIAVLKGSGVTRFRCTFWDSGPGFEDIEAALRDGFSTGSTLGQGLPGVKRIADRFSARSTEKGALIEVDIVQARQTRASKRYG